MNNFCFNAFTGLEVDTRGEITPCCKFLRDKMPKFHISEGIDLYKESDFLKKLQAQFIKNERPDGCRRCWIEEDAGIESKRQLDYTRHKEHFDSLKLDEKTFSNVSISFGNLCNFACRICGPGSSSKWVTELKKQNINDGQIQNWYKKEEYINDIFSNVKDAVHIDVVGGEPLLLDLEEHFNFLNRFNKNQKNKISLHYTTNGSTFPTQPFLDIWQDFKEIDIQLSLDDFGKRFEYNRWPGKWPLVYSNIKKYQTLEKDQKNIRLSISFTVSAFTIYYANNFYQWCLSEGLPTPWLGRLNHPEYYRCNVYPEPIRGKIIEKLSQSTFSEIHKLKEFLQDDSSKYFEQFLTTTNQLDKIRNQNFQTTFPELAELIRHYI